jgi:predicted transcriptional regulator
MSRRTQITEEQALIIMHQYRKGVDSRDTANYIGCSQAFVSTFVRAFNGDKNKLDVLAKEHTDLIMRLSPFYKSKQSTDQIVESIINQFKQRSEVGIAKYGTTLERKDLSTLEWIEHAKQEAMDFILYLERLKQELK